MFGIFSSKKQQVDFGHIGTDMHSHLVPGVDDGAKTIEDSIALIKGLVAMGYKKLITTPHIYSGMYNNSPQTILPSLDLLKAEILRQDIPVEIQAAAEYYLDEHVEELLQKNELLLTFGENYVLVEFSLISPPQTAKTILFDLQVKGYQPVLAHPERYTYLLDNKKLYDELKDVGCLFQLNLLSAKGYYGKPSFELASYLQNRGMFEFVGTDLHHTRHLGTLTNMTLEPKFLKLLKSSKLLNHAI